MNQAPHTLDWFIWLGGKPSRVEARAWTRGHKIEVEDSVTALLEYPNGATGYFYTTSKNRKRTPDKLVLKKYDPVVRKHVEFKESKI